MKIWRKITGLFSIVALAMGMTGVCTEILAAAPVTQKTKDDTVYTKDSLHTVQGVYPGTEKMNLVADNGTLELYADVATGEVAVRNKKNGSLWYTNPPSREEDMLATPSGKKKLASQLYLTYHDKKANVYDMNSYADCVEREQLEYALTENGIRFRYVFGEFEESIIIPRWISEERMKLYLDRMDETQRKFVERQYYYLNLDTIRDREKNDYLKRYPILEEHPIYALRENSEFRQLELMEIFEPLGYTREDFNNDCKENGYDTTRRDAYFIIPLDYRLEGEELVADIPASLVDYDKTVFPLESITLLPYFGAAGVEEEGYILVPDGSGALIRLNNGKKSTGQYSQAVYGSDTLYKQTASLEADASLGVKMPVFGLKSGDRAFLAVIEEGEALATIRADVSGKVDSYNYVQAAFSFLPYGQINIGAVMDETNKLFMYADEAYQGHMRLRFCFLSGEDAGYVGMAKTYREYLTAAGVLTNRETEAYPLYVELIGAVNVQKKFLGVSYNSVQSLTTYEQAREILSELLGGGAEDIRLRMNGWYNGGLGGSTAAGAKKEKRLEKGLSLADFQSYLREQGIPAFFDAEFQYVYKDGFFDSFTTKNWSPKFFDKTTAYLYEYSLATKRIAGKKANLVRANMLGKMVDGFQKSTNNYGLEGLSVGSLSYDVYSDFTQGRQTNRQQSLDISRETLKKLAGDYRLMGENAAFYAIGGLSDVVNVPLYSNLFAILDQEIPFYQLVLRGCADYAGEPLNLAADYKSVWLKSVETGAGLYFKWIYGDNSLLKETDYEDLYSINYRYWLNDAIAMSRRMNEELGGLLKQEITAHEILQNNVTRVTYDNGIRVLVNYNKHEVTVNGRTIPAQDFAVMEG